MRRLREFFFRYDHATPLALLRIAVGALTIVWALTLVLDVDPLLTWLRASSDGDIGWWQPWPGAAGSAVVAMAWCLLVASILLTIGLWTTLAGWLVFFLTLALQRYNPAAFNGGDFILRGVLILGLALSPAGSYLSVDAARRKNGPVSSAPLVSQGAIRFIQLHISLGYLLTVILKLRGSTWLGGTAIWYALGLEDLGRFDVPAWIAAPPVGALLSWSTLLIELGVGVGVWLRRFRPWVLLAGIGLHLGIALVYEIGFFSYVMIVSYLAFLPPRSTLRDYLPARWRLRSRLVRHGVSGPKPA